jgi:hypothetical protein
LPTGDITEQRRGNSCLGYVRLKPVVASWIENWLCENSYALGCTLNAQKTLETLTCGPSIISNHDFI